MAQNDKEKKTSWGWAVPSSVKLEVIFEIVIKVGVQPLFQVGGGGGWSSDKIKISTNFNSSWSCSCSWVRKAPEYKLSRVGGVAGWLDQVGIKLSQLSTKLKFELKLSLAKK